MRKWEWKGSRRVLYQISVCMQIISTETDPKQRRGERRTRLLGYPDELRVSTRWRVGVSKLEVESLALSLFPGEP